MCRVLAVLLLSVLLLGAVAIAEQATQPTAEPTDTEAQTDVGGASLESEVLVEEAAAEEDDLSLDFVGGMKNILESTGFANATWQQYVMIGIACVLLYLAIVKQFEPLLLLPISFGMLLANLPLGGMMDGPTFQNFTNAAEAATFAAKYDASVTLTADELGNTIYQVQTATGGLLYYLYQGVKLGIYPPLIFMGVGAMTDFAPLIASPKSLLLGAAAQLGIFLAFILAKFLGFTNAEAGSIGIIGGADGPTALFVTTRLAPHLLGPIAVAAYSYMALVPVIQPPFMKLLTTKKERAVVMEQMRPVSKRELVIFPIMVTIIVALLLPSAAPLIGMLMLGNLVRVSGVTERLSKTAQNELCNIVTIFLGLTVGATANGNTFLDWDTLKILLLGVFAFSGGTVGGVLLGKLMYKLTGGKVNPLIGSAGVSAVPMAARVSQKVAQEENPGNFILMHAMGPNVAGVIGSAVAAGVLLALF